MASHSSILAWKVSWTEESGGLQSMGYEGAGLDHGAEHAQGVKWSSDRRGRCPPRRPVAPGLLF